MINRVRNLIEKFSFILTKQQKVYGIGVFVLSTIGAVFEMLGVSVILPLVEAMIYPDELLSGKYSYICKTLGIVNAKQLLLIISMGIVAIYLFKNVYLSFLSWVRIKYSMKVQRELSSYMLSAYMEHGYTFFRMTNPSTLVRGVVSSVASVSTVLHLLMKILAEVLSFVCIAIYIIYTDWQMALCLMLLVGVSFILILGIFRSMMRRTGTLYHQNVALMTKWIMQLFSSIKETLVLNRQSYFINNYERSFVKQQKGRINQTMASEAPTYIIEGVCVCGIMAAVYIRIMSLANPAEYMPYLAVFAMAAFRLFPSVGRITSHVNTCVFYLPALEEVYKNLNDVYKDSSQNMIHQEDYGKVLFNEALEIKNISWKYPDGEKNIFENISLTITKGEAIAFVGPSGAGKSTLADIILGLFVPQSGDVLIDGKSILNNRMCFSELISFVPQSVYLLDDTIRRNIAFGIPDAEINEGLVWEALKQAQLSEYVLGLSNGLDTVVGERGVRFSGGQAQRIAIARALYTKPEIIVLDEATSALDNETERAVMEAIDSLHGKITLIIIAHRLSTIRNCDRIYEINNGLVTEKKYSELI